MFELEVVRLRGWGKKLEQQLHIIYQTLSTVSSFTVSVLPYGLLGLPYYFYGCAKCLSRSSLGGSSSTIFNTPGLSVYLSDG